MRVKWISLEEAKELYPPMAKKKRCPTNHRHILVKTEKDRCSWVQCVSCKKRGPHKHSMTLALIAWALKLTDQHPRA